MSRSTRFSYIAYDKHSAELQATFKAKFEEVESLCSELEEGRPKSLLLTALEEAYMWSGKAIRDSQIKRTGQVNEQAHRNNE